jgi:hypothetical protein
VSCAGHRYVFSIGPFKHRTLRHSGFESSQTFEQLGCHRRLGPEDADNLNRATNQLASYRVERIDYGERRH